MGQTTSNETNTIFQSKDSACFESDWFSKGTSRVAFKGEMHSSGKLTGQKCVVKVFIKEFAEKIGNWDADTKASYKALELSDAFNRTIGKQFTVNFVIPRIATIKSIAGFDYFWLFSSPEQISNPNGSGKVSSSILMKTGEFVGIEDYLTGVYDKWNCNNGYVNPNLDTDVTEAFSHFSYHYSNGEVLICDLQGVQTNNKYKLTDPAIHSRIGPGYYGPTDCGSIGFQRFFESHICTQYCNNQWRKWKSDPRITALLKKRGLPKSKKGSTYIYEYGLKDVQYGENNSRALTKILE